jgi:hypothetical protein
MIVWADIETIPGPVLAIGEPGQPVEYRPFDPFKAQAEQKFGRAAALLNGPAEDEMEQARR